MAANKSFDCMVRFGAIHTGYKTKEYLFKNDRLCELFPSEGQFIPGKIFYYRLTELAFPFSFIVKTLIDLRLFDFKSS